MTTAITAASTANGRHDVPSSFVIKIVKRVWRFLVLLSFIADVSDMADHANSSCRSLCLAFRMRMGSDEVEHFLLRVLG